MTHLGGFFSNWVNSKQDRVDEGKELYGQAANCFKLANNFDRAIYCFKRCIEYEEREQDAAQFYLEIAHIYKKESQTSQYLESSKKAIDMFCFGKRISQAASLAKECAEYLEEIYDYEEATKLYL